MKTIEDYEPGEIVARSHQSIPLQRKRQLVQQLIEVGRQHGGQNTTDALDYLDCNELELLAGMLGMRFPLSEEELADAVMLFLLTNGTVMPSQRKRMNSNEGSPL
jgi:hypothetical protein